MKTVIILLHLIAVTSLAADKASIFFLAGKASHASGEHEFFAGCSLLSKALNEQNELPLKSTVIKEWPADDSVLDGAKAIVIYCDADKVHRNHYPRLKELNEAGTGVFFMHYGVHPPADKGKEYYLPMVGGFMETGFSVNPHWAADLIANKDHPVHHGCDKPISAYDEFYYSLRFADDDPACDCAVHSLATAIPSAEVIAGESNLWNDNATKNYGIPQRLLWGFERKDGTRGGGFTGGHFHRNWAIDDYRKLILNTIVWIAGFDVPENGIQSASLTEDEINANLAQKKKMKHITLPLKNPMEYRADAIESRREKALQLEEKAKRKAAKKAKQKQASAKH